MGGSRPGSGREGHTVAGNSAAASPLTRKADKVDLHGMHKRFVRVQSARSAQVGAEGPADLAMRPATQGGRGTAPIVGMSLRRGGGSPVSQLRDGAAVAGGAPAHRGAHDARSRDAAALAAAEEEGLSAWRASLDGWERDAVEQHVCAQQAGRAGVVGKPGEQQRGEPWSRGGTTAPAASGAASHRMVLAAATAAKKLREEKS